MKFINTKVDSKKKGHYSSGVISNGLLFISGQLAIDQLTNKVPSGGIKEHMEQALINLDNVLSCANLTRKDIIQCRLYITDINGWDEVNNIYKKYFEDHKPARAILPVGELHYGSLIEIEAVAEVNN